MKEQAILNAFTESSEGLNEALNKLTVKCVNSKNNKFSLDCDGNLSVNSITTSQNGNGLTMNDIYPVGAIYFSMSATSPVTLFGGIWEQIQDKFLLCAGTTYKPGTSGGSAIHNHATGDCVLTSNQIPSHTHDAALNNTGGHRHMFWFGGGANSGDGEQIPVADTRWGRDYAGQTEGEHDHGGIRVDATGGNQAHNHGNTGNANNMPPYLSVYVWKRIS